MKPHWRVLDLCRTDLAIGLRRIEELFKSPRSISVAIPPIPRSQSGRSGAWRTTIPLLRDGLGHPRVPGLDIPLGQGFDDYAQNGRSAADARHPLRLRNRTTPTGRVPAFPSGDNSPTSLAAAQEQNETSRWLRTEATFPVAGPHRSSVGRPHRPGHQANEFVGRRRTRSLPQAISRA